MSNKLIEEFLDGLALMMENEDEWSAFMLMLDARRKALKARAK